MSEILFASRLMTLRLAHHFFHPLDDVRRLIDHLFCQGFEPLAADRCYLPLPLLCFRDKFRIFQHVEISFAEQLHTISGDAWGRQDRAAESVWDKRGCAASSGSRL